MPKFALHLRSTNTIEPRHCHSTLKNYVLSRNVQVPDCSSNVLTESRQRVAREEKLINSSTNTNESRRLII